MRVFLFIWSVKSSCLGRVHSVMPFIIFAIAFTAVLLVPCTTSSLGIDRYNNAARRISRQATVSNTQLEQEEGYCVLPPPLDHGRFTPSSNRCPNSINSAACQMIPGTPVPPQWVIFHSCNPGYKLHDGKRLSVCVNGMWRPPLPECVVHGCFLPVKPTHGSYQTTNQCRPHEVGVDVCRGTPGTLVPSSWTIKYTCSPGYFLNTTSDLSSCDNATWTNPVDCVSNECPRPKSQSVKIVCSNEDSEALCDRPIRPGTTVKTECSEYYRPVNVSANQILTCLEGGKWDRPLSKCNPVCGVPQVQIFNSSSTMRGSFPWLAAVYHYSEDSQEYQQLCGGILITPQIVMTAAHCVINERLNSTGLKVGLGKYFRDMYINEPSSYIADVKKVILPSNYVGLEANFALDLGLLELTKSVKVTAFIMPVCIDWSNTFNPSLDEEGVMAGWGVTQSGQSSYVVMAKHLAYMGYVDCKKFLKNNPIQAFLTHDKFCGKVKGLSPDKGDSGGALTFVKNGQHYVVGILSTKLNEVLAFTNIMYGEHMSWLKSQIGD